MERRKSRVRDQFDQVTNKCGNPRSGSAGAIKCKGLEAPMIELLTIPIQRQQLVAAQISALGLGEKQRLVNRVEQDNDLFAG